MSELVKRYVHQVGRYLPPGERAEIEAELRSQIQDTLEDRYGELPTQMDVIMVLREFGDPRTMATSYDYDRFLIGPDLYPYMLRILQRVWLIVPSIAIFLSIFVTLTAGPQPTLTNLTIAPLFAAVQATFVISAIVVLIFSIIQHTGVNNHPRKFDPLNLPAVDDPGMVDHVEATFGVGVGSFVVLLFVYYLYIGGLTFRFDVNTPDDLLAVPALWLLALIVVVVGQIAVHAVVLWHDRWNSVLWLTQTVLEVAGVICLYFAVLQPVVDRYVTTNPESDITLLINVLPELYVVGYAIITLIARGNRLARLWGYNQKSLTTMTVVRNK